MDQFDSTQDTILQHSFFQKLSKDEHLQIFLKHQVFGTWNYMSLLKRLQMDLSCVTLPWLPHPYPEHTTYINELVAQKETHGNLNSFKEYVRLSKERGVDTMPIVTYITRLQELEDPILSLHAQEIPDSIATFTEKILKLAMHGKTHEVAAVFCITREKFLPHFFSQINAVLKKHNLKPWLEHSDFIIKPDLQKIENLLNTLCGGDPEKLTEASNAIRDAFEARIIMLDGVVHEMDQLQ
ncbi:hypothetical protein A374_13445 [Fictibacillus macauensis ZFHKF-1]|uniref:DUF3050 domain-containing protein n=2 Tax=Fictibacillus TaxID=1329200 RepID=I8AGZ5_9BACL|nr:hypothetical protein A374_13445 [Fictibacillus macauensis ZFHKF-1]